MPGFSLFMARFIDQAVHVFEIVVRILHVHYEEIVALLRNGLIVLRVIGREKKDGNGLLVVEL
ncbi:MAG TPA: hypothetical protein VEJ88_08585, partial [Dissulfurispiraceae bacterium]|nr:hypothetical protein [Dissulfurispiraceae bacterium]